MTRTTNYKFIECGTYGHAWFEADSDWRAEFGSEVTFRCERCTAERRESWSEMTGQMFNRHYVYPDGYSFHGRQRPSRDDFRAMLMDKRRKELRRQMRAVS